MSAVDLCSVEVTFHGGTRHANTALTAVDLVVQAGEFVSIIGPSGCGKSTLLRIVANLIEPTSGSVSVHGKPAAAARRDRDYGIVFQDPGLLDWRNVIKNVELPLELRGWRPVDRRRRAAELLESVQLGDRASAQPWELSGGQRQRVAIARALAGSPELLLMDEPFGSLDEITREHLQAVLVDVWSRAAPTVLFVTHSISEAVFLSTRVAVMSSRPGRITEVIDVDLPASRTDDLREEDRFVQLVSRVRDALRNGDPNTDSQYR